MCKLIESIYNGLIMNDFLNWVINKCAHCLLCVRAHQQYTQKSSVTPNDVRIFRKKTPAKSHTERSTWWVRCITVFESIDIYKWL